MKKTLLTIAICLGVATSTFAGGNIFNHLGLGVGVGTTGIDIEAGTTCTNWLQFRAGVAIMPVGSYSGISTDLNVNQQQWAELQSRGEIPSSVACPKDLKMDANFNLTNFKFLVDFFPIPASSFHITAGFFVGNSQIIDVVTTNCQDAMQAITDYNARPTTEPAKQIGVELGDYKILPNGDHAKGFIKVKGFKPYLGLGFGRIVPKRTRLSFACDAGVQFWSTPTIQYESSTGNVDLTDKLVASDKGGVVKVLSKITVYPVLNFRLTGKIF